MAGVVVTIVMLQILLGMGNEMMGEDNLWGRSRQAGEAGLVGQVKDSTERIGRGDGDQMLQGYD